MLEESGRGQAGHEDHSAEIAELSQVPEQWGPDGPLTFPAGYGNKGLQQGVGTGEAKAEPADLQGGSKAEHLTLQALTEKLQCSEEAILHLSNKVRRLQE